MGEEIAATPGWVSGELDDVLGGLPKEAGFSDARTAYADCLANCKGPMDGQVGQERCRQELLSALTGLGLQASAVHEIGSRLEAIEAEISERT